MSYVARPLAVSLSADGQAGLEYYNPSDMLNYNAPYTVMAWHRYGQTYPRGMVFHLGKRDVIGWNACDSMGPHNEVYRMKASISTKDDVANYVLTYNEAGESLHPVTGMLVPTQPDFSATGDPLWTYPWNAIPPTWYRGYQSWGHFAFVRESAVTFKVYINAVLILNINHAGFPLTRGPADGLLFGGRYIDPVNRKQGTYQNIGHDGKWAYARAFASALTQEQVQAEMGFSTAGGLGGGGAAWADWPLETDYLDVSGNGRHLALGAGMPATAYDANAAEYFKWDAELPAGVTSVTPPDVGEPLGARMRVLTALDARLRTRVALDARVRSLDIFPARVRALPLTPE